MALGATSLVLLGSCTEPQEPPKSNPAPDVRERSTLFLGPSPESSRRAQGELPQIRALAFVEHSFGLASGGSWREHPLLHDFDGDSAADLVASNREEDGLNAWRAPNSKGASWTLSIEGLPRDLMYGGCDAGDLDGDGDSDLVFGSPRAGLRVFLNDGDLHWTESASSHDNPFRMLDVCLGDLNGDDHLDVVGIGHFSGPGAGVFLGDGKGKFRRLPESASIFDSKTFGTVIELADLDADGNDDLFFSCEKGPRVFRTLIGEAGLSWLPSSQGLPTTTIGNICRACVPADLNGDGSPELIAGQLSDPNTAPEDLLTAGVYSWDPATSNWELAQSGLPTHLSIADAAAADFDGDGHMDILLVSIEEGAVIYLGDGALGFTLAGQLCRVPNPRVALGDANGDGRVDVAILHGATKSRPDGGGVQVFLNTAEAW